VEDLDRRRDILEYKGPETRNGDDLEINKEAGAGTAFTFRGKGSDDTQVLANERGKEDG
jgi:hypothetical protein